MPLLTRLAALVLPVPCAGCRRPGQALCATCGASCAPLPTKRTLHSGLVVWSALEYADVPRHVLLAFKNGGRTDLARVLAPALAAAIDAAIRSDPIDRVLLAPMPASRRSRRERGYDPVRVLLRRAALPASRVLAASRRSADQVTLGRLARSANVAGSMRARVPKGTCVLLVDDVVTTGATLEEAARAVAVGGARVVGAATVASTPQRVT